MTQVPDPDGVLVDAPGGAAWRDDTGRRALLGAALIPLSRSGTPQVGAQWQFQDGAGLSTVASPPGGWSKVTLYRLLLLTAAGIPVSSVGDSEPHLEVRRVLSPGSPVIDLTLAGYDQNNGYTGNLGDLRSYVGPLRFNVRMLEDVPDGLAWVQLVLQVGASTV